MIHDVDMSSFKISIMSCCTIEIIILVSHYTWYWYNTY